MSDQVPARRRQSDLAPLNPTASPAPIPARPTTLSQHEPTRATPKPASAPAKADRPSTPERLESGSFSVEHISATHITINITNTTNETHVEQYQNNGVGGDDDRPYDMRYERGESTASLLQAVQTYRTPLRGMPRTTTAPRSGGGQILGALGCLGVVILAFVGAAFLVGWVMHAVSSPTPSVLIHETTERPRTFDEYLRQQNRNNEDR